MKESVSKKYPSHPIELCIAPFLFLRFFVAGITVPESFGFFSFIFILLFFRDHSRHSLSFDASSFDLDCESDLEHEHSSEIRRERRIHESDE